MVAIISDTENLTPDNYNVSHPVLLPLFHPDWLTDPAKTPIPAWKKYLSLVSTFGEAKIAVLSCDLSVYYASNKREFLHSFLQKAATSNIPVWVFTGGDSGITLASPGIFTIRMGGLLSRNAGNQYVMPPYFVDPIQQYFSRTSPPFRPWNRLPVLGFCGQANGSISKRIKEFLLWGRKHVFKWMGKYPFDIEPLFFHSAFRATVLQYLANSGNITCNFLLNKQYRAGAKTPEQRLDSSIRYFNNMLESDYILCIRGGGNFSVRFYETLACGRIPVLLDTDCNLPLPGIIEWKKHCVIIPHKHYKNVHVHVKNFHDKLDETSFRNLQMANRELWLSHLTYEGFWESFLTLMDIPDKND